VRGVLRTIVDGRDELVRSGYGFGVSGRVALIFVLGGGIGLVFGGILFLVLGFPLPLVTGEGVGVALAVVLALALDGDLAARARTVQSRFLVRAATFPLPDAFRDRYHEEWTGELAAMASRSRRLRACFLAHLLLVGVPRLVITLHLAARLGR
jgi:hypothetical protein